ncbi:MBL fold metallo-hydrolase [Guptibacillus algicola]|uniref:MBL fold metallo-hydrolase n=1 Tax=Guptibacillus algicola TaxID=225844 RepID=UPI001CD29F0B|nr:MBL fold metallo-hydrolase [Alkalihalobacillus algicola]MCA0985923.1 MBL fold metallo-hydrolase [Alkalihalobacillus algicola]
MTVTMANKLLPITVPTPFKVGPVNCFLIKGEVITLVDTGPRTAEAEEALVSQLREYGLSLEDVEQIVLTHHHPDHMGLAGQMSKAGKKVLGHWKNDRWLEMTDAFLEDHESFMKIIYSEAGVPEEYLKHVNDVEGYLSFADRTTCDVHLLDGDAVPGCSGWTVIETPGHAQSHISLYHESSGIMIAGDHLIKNISSNPILEPPYVKGADRPRPLLQQRDSYKKTLEIKPSFVYTGHGEPIDNIEDLIKERLIQQEARAKKVAMMIKEEPMTAFEVCQKLFPGIYKKEIGLTLSETIGQLDYLESEGVIARKKQQENILYTQRLGESYEEYEG